MSNKLYKVFEDVEQNAQLLSKYWHNFSSEISEHLPDTYHAELQELSDKLERAIDNLVDELRNPTLTLATTGTTSSGKSTLVNLLCGAEIVPVAVSEMSAGAVTIEYSEKKSLIIHETPGALWECGEWTGISDERIYQRLYDVMISYIDNREKQANLGCPQSTIYYPFRLIKESKLELPRGVKVRILDLPGLAYVGDEGNANVIKQCREALCLVTYNSAETDKEKVRSLLQEVVEQVKDLGGSPARMLFILNRIDVFRADRNWPETETRFVEDAISKIKKERIYNSVEEIFKCHISYLKEGTNEKAPNMVINFPESELSKVDKTLSFQVNFKSGFAIKLGTWQEEIEVPQTRRSWYTLFIFKETYYETKYETRSSDNAEIPSVDNLFSGWRDQSKQSRAEIAQQIMRWLVEQMDCLKKNVDEFQTNVINRYQERLDMAHREITLDFENQKNIWQPIHCKAKDLREEFYSLAKVLKDIS
ncbi:dynamin family protein [Nostoc sp.]|uniref:dynamin family protein n=1 Tax=Nostoc sp. TaxID=1180 RepID=UPI002FF8DEDF